MRSNGLRVVVSLAAAFFVTYAALMAGVASYAALINDDRAFDRLRDSLVFAVLGALCWVLRPRLRDASRSTQTASIHHV